MENNEIPTIAELFNKYSDLRHFEEDDAEYLIDWSSFKESVREFTTAHVSKALEMAAENAETETFYDPIEECPYEVIDKKSILNCYPKELIR
jgi:hypothetical protein